jgi:hypothetical protein
MQLFNNNNDNNNNNNNDDSDDAFIYCVLLYWHNDHKAN